jgi:hypothetical protein
MAKRRKTSDSSSLHLFEDVAHYFIYNMLPGEPAGGQGGSCACVLASNLLEWGCHHWSGLAQPEAEWELSGMVA